MKVSKTGSTHSTKTTHHTEAGTSKSKTSKLVSPRDKPLSKKNPSFNAHHHGPPSLLPRHFSSEAGASAPVRQSLSATDTVALDVPRV
ncbi:hypothetical protein [Myxococcus sp. RHSTA-1-4]|uniref:hypothetical protein n=1 Tax=Myxococcus sp. RHSTA-1-4 TaxID=2874601 RepID=UPI001CBFABE5|nr:hypothetical protein [Myxococcus sp. RHSTA-1-4]MBZ4422497.1 hypothetical protein [Myxococcus sp. RHSTA-1-4]